MNAGDEAKQEDQADARRGTHRAEGDGASEQQVPVVVQLAVIVSLLLSTVAVLCALPALWRGLLFGTSGLLLVLAARNPTTRRLCGCILVVMGAVLLGYVGIEILNSIFPPIGFPTG